MRSHMTAAAPEIPTTSEDSGGAYTLRENPRKSFRIADPEFSSSVAVLDAGSVQDGESETESPTPSRNHRRRRSKRRRRVPPEPEPASSVSDGTEEDVAISLMMLSRDVWTEPPSPEEEQIRRFQCEECKRVFRSYQALGGHRASHKRTSQGCLPAAAGNAGGQKVHECPVCFRVFGSGQALGGHKRSQLCSAIAARTAMAAPNVGLIDLNMPAPVEDDDAVELELSAVSDAEFVVNYQTDPVGLSFR